MIVAGKQPGPRWLTWTSGETLLGGHRHREWRATTGARADVVMACAGVFRPWRRLRRSAFCARPSQPEDRVINIVDMMTHTAARNTRTDSPPEFDTLFDGQPIIFAYRSRG